MKIVNFQSKNSYKATTGTELEKLSSGTWTVAADIPGSVYESTVVSYSSNIHTFRIIQLYYKDMFMVLANSAFENNARIDHPNNYGYKVSTNTWINFGQLSVPKRAGGGVVHDNTILVV